MATKTVLIGDKELTRKLKNLSLKLGKKIVRAAGRPAMRVVLAEAKRNAPKDSGLLQRSIKIRSIKRSRKMFGIKLTSGTRTTDFGGKAFYGAFQEFGWQTGKRGSENRRQIPGKHFMEKAAKSKAREALKIYTDLIRDGIIREAKNG